MAPGAEEGIVGDEQRIGVLLHNARKSRLNVALGASWKDGTCTNTIGSERVSRLSANNDGVPAQNSTSGAAPTNSAAWLCSSCSPPAPHR